MKYMNTKSILYRPRNQNTIFELKDEKEILGFVRNEEMYAELFTFYNYAVVCNINNDFWSN